VVRCSVPQARSEAESGADVAVGAVAYTAGHVVWVGAVGTDA
jgi:hypothetical protein